MVELWKLLLIDFSLLVEQWEAIPLCACYRISGVLSLFMALPWEMGHVSGFFPLAYSW